MTRDKIEHVGPDLERLAGSGPSSRIQDPSVNSPRLATFRGLRWHLVAFACGSTGVGIAWSSDRRALVLPGHAPFRLIM